MKLLLSIIFASAFTASAGCLTTASPTDSRGGMTATAVVTQTTATVTAGYSGDKPKSIFINLTYTTTSGTRQYAFFSGKTTTKTLSLSVPLCDGYTRIDAVVTCGPKSCKSYVR